MTTGEIPTDFGPVDCPDCGGAGHLPSRAVLVEWRSRDLERALARGRTPNGADLTWLLAELRTARGALNEILALAHDLDETDSIGTSIRFAANRALGLYEAAPVSAASDEAQA
jgi:hypothetical protein